jgi:carbonic anhydrase
MRKFGLVLVIATLAIFAVVALGGCDSTPADPQFNHRAPDEIINDSAVALARLKDGNVRFETDNLKPRNTNLSDRNIAATGQWPYAVVLTCADSRVAPEIYLDKKVGDIFVIRNAGNIADQTALGSLEFAVEHLGASLVVVIGHEACGAVIGAFGGGQDFEPNLQAVLNHVAGNIVGSPDADQAIQDNIESVVQTIRNNSVVQRMGAEVVGGYYEISTGKVIFND